MASLQQLNTYSFCGKLLYIGEAVSRKSQIPRVGTIILAETELRECDRLIKEVLSDDTDTDILDGLIKIFQLPTACTFIHRLLDINENSYQAHLDRLDDPRYNPQPWFRIVNTYNMIFVLEALRDQCDEADWEEEIEQAWLCYDKAVVCANQIQYKNGNRKDLICVIEKHLNDSRVFVEKVTLAAEVLESL